LVIRFASHVDADDAKELATGLDADDEAVPIALREQIGFPFATSAAADSSNTGWSIWVKPSIRVQVSNSAIEWVWTLQSRAKLNRSDALKRPTPPEASAEIPRWSSISLIFSIFIIWKLPEPPEPAAS